MRMPVTLNVVIRKCMSFPLSRTAAAGAMPSLSASLNWPGGPANSIHHGKPPRAQPTSCGWGGCAGGARSAAASAIGLTTLPPNSAVVPKSCSSQGSVCSPCSVAPGLVGFGAHTGRLAVGHGATQRAACAVTYCCRDGRLGDAVRRRCPRMQRNRAAALACDSGRAHQILRPL